jgi:hypothetical protein
LTPDPGCVDLLVAASRDRVSQFVVSPLGGSVWYREMDLWQFVVSPIGRRRLGYRGMDLWQALAA